jgi:hypothetical protein
MPAQYPPYSVSRNSRESHRNSGSPHRHTRRTNARPFTSRETETGKWPTLKGHLVAASGEFVGTTMFLFFAFGGTQVASMSSGNKALDTSGVLFISLSFGFSLAVNAWAFYRISGGLFNPAVSCFGTVHDCSTDPSHCEGHARHVRHWHLTLDPWSISVPFSDGRRSRGSSVSHSISSKTRIGVAQRSFSLNHDWFPSLYRFGNRLSL